MPEKRTSPKHKASYRIVIVEDQREISRLLRSALETLEQDIEVVEIPSGEEAILDSSHKNIDLLVADYRLPGMSGLELMKKVRGHHANAKVILITGQTDPRIRKAVSDSGADAFFIKPVPMADFLDAVERHLGLVETLLPPEPIAAANDVIRVTMPDLLTNLRQDLNAKAVMLITDSGHVLARAGDLPDGNAEVSLLSSILSIHSAGQKVARMLGQKELSSWSVFNGGDFDLVFSPVGEGHAVLLIGEGLAAEKQVVKTVSVTASARAAIEKALIENIEPLVALKAKPEPKTLPLEAAEVSAKEMEPLFKDAGKKLKPAEVDEFWTKAAKKHKAPTKPDMLSYEQAKQLGLAPEEKP
jgi:DNA-binding response OmpR family regulator